MARPMAPVPLPVLQTNEVHQQLGELAQHLTNDPDVVRFSVQVDNRTGMVSTNVQHKDGSVQHNEWVARDLSQATQLDPHLLTIEDRNSAVLSLLNQGLTQTDVAKRIGISQSRVAQIKKFSSA